MYLKSVARPHSQIQRRKYLTHIHTLPHPIQPALYGYLTKMCVDVCALTHACVNIMDLLVFFLGKIRETKITVLCRSILYVCKKKKRNLLQVNCIDYFMDNWLPIKYPTDPTYFNNEVFKMRVQEVLPP